MQEPGKEMGKGRRPLLVKSSDASTAASVVSLPAGAVEVPEEEEETGGPSAGCSSGSQQSHPWYDDQLGKAVRMDTGQKEFSVSSKVDCQKGLQVYRFADGTQYTRELKCYDAGAEKVMRRPAAAQRKVEKPVTNQLRKRPASSAQAAGKPRLARQGGFTVKGNPAALLDSGAKWDQLSNQVKNSVRSGVYHQCRNYHLSRDAGDEEAKQLARDEAARFVQLRGG